MDPSWEFQAPQFVDFNNLGSEEAEGDDKADEFFNVDMESGQSWTEGDGGASAVGSQERLRPRKLSAEKEKPKKPSNLVTSWGPNVKKVVSGTGSRGMTPKRNALRAAVSATIENIRNSPKMNFKRTPKRLCTSKPSPRLAQRRRSSTVGTTHTEVSRSLAKSSAALPRTPEVVRRYKNKVNVGSNKNVVEVTSRQIKAGSSGLLKTQPVIKQGLTVKPLAQNKPTLTQPKEFNFTTSKPAVRAPTGADAPDFSRMLRSYSRPPAEASQPLRTTQPQPFSRQERPRARSADRYNSNNDPNFKSQAEQIANFHGKTPARFRSRPISKERPKSRNRSASPAPRLTVPVTPQLCARGRTRPTGVLSQAEIEEREMEEHSKKQFKAHGVGETLPRFKHGEVEKKACTVPEPFALSDGGTQPKSREHEDEQFPIPAFTARPVSKKLLEGPQGVPEKKTQNLIVPQSPAFALKSRMAERNEKKAEMMLQAEPEPAVKPRPAPHRGVPVTFPAVTRKMTMPEPFSFEERNSQTQNKKEEKIKKIYNEEKAAREFHANPVPKAVETGGRLPERQYIAPTKPEPFSLAIEERVETRLAKWQDNVAKELEEQRKATQFKATEPKVLTSAPFVPKPSDKPLSEISNVVLHSDKRAEERAAYELERAAKEAALEGARREMEERKKRLEEEELVQARKATVHKAQPIKHYKAIEVKPSDKPLTLPESPQLQAGKPPKSKVANATFSQ